MKMMPSILHKVGILNIKERLFLSERYYFQEKGYVIKGRMTSGELTLARSIFENTIDYNKVWIHNEKYLPGQGERTAMTPNGEMYYPDAVYSSDFSSQSMPGERETVAGASHLFIHEMMHVWQYQKGYAVKLRGLFSGRQIIITILIYSQLLLIPWSNKHL